MLTIAELASMAGETDGSVEPGHLEAAVAEIRAYRKLVRDCPLGYHDGKVIRHRATTEADVVDWLQRLYQVGR